MFKVVRSKEAVRLRVQHQGKVLNDLPGALNMPVSAKKNLLTGGCGHTLTVMTHLEVHGVLIRNAEGYPLDLQEQGTVLGHA